VARVLLSDPSPIGIHVIAKGVKVPSLLFRSIKAGFSQAAALLALQRTMCVDSTNTLRLDWFPSLDAATLAKLIAGKWQIGPTSASTLDLWGELVSRLYTFQKGPYSLSQLNAFSPTGFFCDEFALRIGSPIITAVWGFVGFTGPASLVGSVAWVLDELHTRAEKIGCWVQTFAETRQACRALLAQAGARAFSDAGVAWSLMLEAPVELAAKPTLLCPPTNGFHSLLARCDAIIARAEVEIQIEQDRNLGREPAPGSRPTSPSPSSSAALHSISSFHSPTVRPPSPGGRSIVASSVGPSASHVSFSPPSAPSALGNSSGTSLLHASEQASSLSDVQAYKPPMMQAIPDMNGHWCGDTWGGALDGGKLKSSVCIGAFCKDPARRPLFCNKNGDCSA
jgi:hypothetical protein